MNQRGAILPGKNFLFFLVATVSLFSFALAARGQEALRISLANDVVEETQEQEENTIGYYNLLLGPLAWRFSSGLELEYDDNVLYQDHNPEKDFIFQPSIGTQLHWPVTLENSLDLSFLGGYSIYEIHPSLSHFFMNPGSGLSFNTYIGNCVINLHDRISITEDTYENPTVAGVGNYSQLQNTAGVKSVWDLNRLMAEIGFDHENNVSLADSQEVPDSASENFYAKVGVLPVPEMTIGLEGGGSQINYNSQQAYEPNAYQWNAGAFCQGQISQYLKAELDVGYTAYVPENTVGFTNLNITANPYFQLSVTHEINQHLGYTLSAGRSTSTAYYGEPYDYYFVNWQPYWKFLKNYTLNTPFWWQKGTELYTYEPQGVNYEQYGVGINISRIITKKLTAQVGYQFLRDNSDEQAINYTVNILRLSFSYQF